ncbi:MAG: hypothetical protein AAFY34_11090, partial [Pseudomonadota bacterium]
MMLTIGKYMGNCVLLVLLVIVGFFDVSADAQQDTDPLAEWEKRQNVEQRLRIYGEDLLGDGIDPATGSLVFTQTDVDVPGNFDLPVRIQRKRSMGEIYPELVDVDFADWELVVPRVSAVTISNGVAQGAWHNGGGARCNASFHTSFPTHQDVTLRLDPDDYHNGITMDGPGSGSRQLLYATNRSTGGFPSNSTPQFPAGTKFTTTDNWYFTCISASDGEGLLGHAPNGDKYYFDRVIRRQANAPRFANGRAAGIPRFRVMLMASRVVDVNGNDVVYTYDSLDRLTRIRASDGRQIDVGYSGSSRLIRTVSTSGRTWTYNYRSTSFRFQDWHIRAGVLRQNQVLGSISQPDGTSWSFSLDGMFAVPKPAAGCASQTYSVSVNHPQGVIGTFRLEEGIYRAAESTLRREYPNCPDLFGEQVGGPPPLPPNNVAYIRNYRVGYKELNNGGALSRWNYAYSVNNGERVNTTTVTDPTGDQIRYGHYWPQMNSQLHLGSQLKYREVVSSGGAVLSREDNEWFAEDPVGSPEFSQSLSPPKRYRVLQFERRLTQDGETYTTEYTHNSSFSSGSYSFGFPTRMKEFSTVQSGTRQTDTVYAHNTSRWILGQPSTVTRNGKLFDSYRYDNLGRLVDHNRFGGNYREYTYQSDGTLRTVRDALGRTITLTNYKRGLPQTLTRPDGTPLTRVVDNNGWLTSFKDARGHQTSLGYDTMGRLTLINPPGNRASTTISYVNLGSGIIQTATTGTQRITTNYDRRQRPLLVRTEAISGGGGSIYARMEYDALNRVTFEAFPSISSNESTGTATTYDALGRVVQVRENVSPYATTVTTYLSDNRMRVTDPEGNQTITHRSGYGGPDDGNPILIDMPENLDTSMTYDIYGNLLTSSQGGLTQTWTYDNRLRLRTHFAPEEGCKIYGYDVADQLTSASHGPNASCTPSGGTTISSTYDALGRLTNVTYPSGTASIAMDYDLDGNITRNARGGAIWTYGWDENDQLLTETLQIDGKTFAMAHAYNSSGAETSWTAPNGAVWDFDPDGHGRRTGVRFAPYNWNLLANATYHPNGDLKYLTYWNGYYYESTQNARQQVNYIHHSNVFVQSMGFDKNGRVTSINDWFDNSRDRDFTYDGLGRLKTANGPWGVGRYTYDNRNNLVKKELGSRTVAMTYSASNGRLTLSTDTDDNNIPRSYTYDARGNMIDKFFALGFTYDRANQPTSMSGTDNGTFVYDGNYKRVKQTINGETIYSVYDLTGTLVWREQNGWPVSELSVGGQSTRIGGTAPNIHKDHLGSVVAASNFNGVAWREDYTPFGESRLQPAGNEDSHNFTGHIRDADTGL